VLLYAQDHDELLPEASTVWGELNLDKGVLICPTAGKKLPNGYGYNGISAGQAIGDFTEPTNTTLLADARTADHLIYGHGNADLRHGKKAIAAYLDGHVEIANVVRFAYAPMEDLMEGMVAGVSTGNWSATGTGVTVTSSSPTPYLWVSGSTSSAQYNLGNRTNCAVWLLSGEVNLSTVGNGGESNDLRVRDSANNTLFQLKFIRGDPLTGYTSTSSGHVNRVYFNKLEIDGPNTGYQNAWRAFALTVCQGTATLTYGNKPIATQPVMAGTWSDPKTITLTNNANSLGVRALTFFAGGTSALIPCPNCKASVSTAWRFCPYCGQAL
jgi:prepilin-type processing-associated H-X9-DG protein